MPAETGRGVLTLRGIRQTEHCPDCDGPSYEFLANARGGRGEHYMACVSDCETCGGDGVIEFYDKPIAKVAQ